MKKEETIMLLENVVYKDFDLFVGEYESDARLYLQVRYFAPCNITGEVVPQSGRKWLLSPFMTKSEIVQTAFKACLTAEEHECRENFKYHGKAIFGPHYNVDALWEIVDRQDKRP